MNYSKNCTAMTIGEIITKHFDEFSGMVRNPDVVIENGNTSEDVIQSAIYTVLKKYKEKTDVDEEEAYEYTKKTILTELFFCWKRKSRDILVFDGTSLDNIN